MSVGGQEIGQGTFTVMAQMAAAALGVPYDWVRVTPTVDTKYSPYEWQTVASRLTWSMGNAVKAAARDAAGKSWRWWRKRGAKTSTTWISSMAT